ncbi:MAG: hypothetical protein AAGF67_10625 [Verrucomicrobiota bacterium]
MTRLDLSFLLPSIAIVFACGCEAADYEFDGSMPRKVLENYLSRSVTHTGLCDSHPDAPTSSIEEDVRMLVDIGAKFVGRTAFVWDLPAKENPHFEKTRKVAAKIHEADPEIILQACIFEAVFPKANRIPVPAWVFKDFEIPVEDRNFQYEAMLYDDGSRVGQWRGTGSVPDMSQLETRLWFYYRARRYIDCGMEALHFGQVMIMNEADPGHRHWFDLLTRVRSYAKRHGRRNFVLCDAHTHGVVEGGRLLFDFHSFPLRIDETKGKPQEGHLSKTGAGKIFGRSKGGMTPSGWSCESLPYLVEFDNWGYSGKGGQSVGGIWVWGYDEMSWFAHQESAYRAHFLRYSHSWLKKQAPNGFLQIPTRRKLAAPVDKNVRMFRAHDLKEGMPYGFGLVSTIQEVWGTGN